MKEFEKPKELQENEELKQIERDVRTLADTMNELSDLVNEQSESIDTLEDFISESKNDIKQGDKLLVESQDYKESTNWYHDKVVYTLGGLVSLGIIIFIL
jgi:t-SNARE complex subunit (syntaxin)